MLNVNVREEVVSLRVKVDCIQSESGNLLDSFGAGVEGIFLSLD